MAMALLPVVERELRVLARRNVLYWGRLVFAGLIMFVGALFLLSMRDAAPAQVSQAMFGTLSVLVLIYVGFAGIWSTSDCLSEEKRSNTLGLLFLTTLKGHDVVLGKMLATSIRSLYGLLGVFPVLAIPLILGGLVVGEVLRILVVLLVALFLSLSVGVAVSAVSRQASRAAIATFGILLACFAGGPLLALLLRFSWPLMVENGGELWFLSPSLAFTMTSAFESSYIRVAQAYWAGIGINTGLAFGALVFACWKVRRGWRVAESGSEGGGGGPPMAKRRTEPQWAN